MRAVAEILLPKLNNFYIAYNSIHNCNSFEPHMALPVFVSGCLGRRGRDITAQPPPSGPTKAAAKEISKDSRLADCGGGGGGSGLRRFHSFLRLICPPSAEKEGRKVSCLVHRVRITLSYLGWYSFIPGKDYITSSDL